jgi:hypothetical protein
MRKFSTVAPKPSALTPDPQAGAPGLFDVPVGVKPVGFPGYSVRAAGFSLRAIESHRLTRLRVARAGGAARRMISSLRSDEGGVAAVENLCIIRAGRSVGAHD